MPVILFASGQTDDPQGQTLQRRVLHLQVEILEVSLTESIQSIITGERGIPRAGFRARSIDPRMPLRKRVHRVSEALVC